MSKKIKLLTFVLLLSFLVSVNYSLALQENISSSNLSANGLCISTTTVTWGGNGTDWGEAVAVDSHENIIIVGYSESISGNQVSVVKFDSYLNYLWNATWKINELDESRDLVIDSDDNIIVIGYEWQGPTIDNQTKNVFILKFSSAGNLLWNQTWQTLSYEDPYSIALDLNNDIYISGSTTGSLGSIFLLKYSSNGIFQWNNSYDGYEQAYAYDLVVNGTEDLYLTGMVEYPYMKQLLVAKFNATGYNNWTTTIGGFGTEDIGKGIALSGDDIYVVGQTESLADYLIDTILIKFNSTGDIQWFETWDYEQGNSITMRPDGNIVIAGNLENAAGVFLVEYGPDAMLRWNTTWIGEGLDYGMAVCAGEDNLYLVGRTTSFGLGDFDMLLLVFQPVIYVTLPPEIIIIPDDGSDTINVNVNIFDEPMVWILFTLLVLILIIVVILLVLQLIKTERRPRKPREVKEPKTETKTIIKERVITKEGPPGPEKRPDADPLTMESDIYDAPEVGPATERQFKKLRIKKVKDFMEKTPEEIVAKLVANNYKRLQVEDIERMQTEAQLMLDIPKLRVHDSVILFRIGIKSKLALSRANQDDLWVKVQEVLKDNHVRKFIRWSNLEPTYEEMAEWISETKK
ncbi:MAG TPA: DUF4332 domain-containing protein [Candidatus Bathyarchaeia archaeon]|nr:DUF4332 domain-containing protein [Candidatus Bathyarchaeia archaeon]